MDMFKKVMVFLYFLMYFVIGGALIILSLTLLPFEKITEFMKMAYESSNIKLGIGVVGIIILVIGIISTKVKLGKLQREKTIAFENPDGQVIVSLAAIEDYIRRVIKVIPQVKDLKSTVTASKKGISVTTRATLFSDSNIPEVTERIQTMIKTKLVEMLGIEESINVKIHVTKLINRGTKEDTQEEVKELSRHVPFREME